ncbi:MAG: alpha/beta fold hydrolase [Pseudomonadota bacterium]
MSARRIMQLLLLAQVVLACVLGWLYQRFGGVAAAPLALLLGAATVLLARLLITANNFLVSRRYSSPTPAAYALGPKERLRMVGEEFVASMFQSSWFMARARACERIYQDAPAPPVLLLHGYGCNSGYWAQLIARLDLAHISHAALDLEPVLGDIDHYVPLAASAIELLCARAGATQVVIVAHSMGGLVARAYLAAHGAGRIARIITLGTPHQGTRLARFAPGPNAAQMRCGAPAEGGAIGASAWLHALDAGETPASRALLTCLFTHHDNIVAPQLSGQLPGARNVAFGGVGHVALGRNPRVLDFLMQEIIRARAPATVNSQKHAL